MTDKQSRFVDEYLLDLNASAAALRAGYSHEDYGRQLLTKTKDVTLSDTPYSYISIVFRHPAWNPDKRMNDIPRARVSDGRQVGCIRAPFQLPLPLTWVSLFTHVHTTDTPARTLRCGLHRERRECSGGGTSRWLQPELRAASDSETSGTAGNKSAYAGCAGEHTKESAANATIQRLRDKSEGDEPLQNRNYETGPFRASRVATDRLTHLPRTRRQRAGRGRRGVTATCALRPLPHTRRMVRPDAARRGVHLFGGMER